MLEQHDLLQEMNLRLNNCNICGSLKYDTECDQDNCINYQEFKKALNRYRELKGLGPLPI